MDVRDETSLGNMESLWVNVQCTTAIGAPFRAPARAFWTKKDETGSGNPNNLWIYDTADKCVVIVATENDLLAMLATHIAKITGAIGSTLSK